LLLGWSAVFPAVSSWLDFPLHRVGASDPESKPLEEVMRLIKPQGGRCQKRRSMKQESRLLPDCFPVRPVAKPLSGTALIWVFQVLLVDQQPRLLLCISGIYRAPI